MIGIDPEQIDPSTTDGHLLKTVGGVAQWTSGGGGTVDSVVAGTGISVDSTDPANPIVSATGGGSGGTTSASAWGAKISDPLTSLSTLTQIAGTWAITGGVVQQTATTQTEGRALNRSMPQGAMGYTQVDVRLDTDGGGANTRIGVDIFAPNSTAGSGTVIYLQKSGTNWNLVVECTGTAVITTVASVAPYATGTWYTLSAAHTAGGIEVYFNGTFMCLAAAQPNRSGNAPYVGLYSYGCAASFRNLKTWGIASPTSSAAGTGVAYPPGSADKPPTSPNAKDDEFDGTSSVAWTSTPTAPNAWDVNTSRAHHAYLKASGSAAAYVGKYQAIPASYPFTITTKVSSTARANYQRGGGIILGPAAPVSTNNMVYLGSLYNAGRVVERITAQFGGTFVSQTAAILSAHWGPVYLKMVATSATSISTYASTDGFNWMPVETGLNPGFTPGVMGIALNDETAAIGSEAWFDFFRIT